MRSDRLEARFKRAISKFDGAFQKEKLCSYPGFQFRLWEENTSNVLFVLAEEFPFIRPEVVADETVKAWSKTVQVETFPGEAKESL